MAETSVVGWVYCQLSERKADVRCFRVWEVGNNISACKGPDHSKMCFKCSSADHKTSSYKQEDLCDPCKVIKLALQRANKGQIKLEMKFLQANLDP